MDYLCSIYPHVAFWISFVAAFIILAGVALFGKEVQNKVAGFGLVLLFSYLPLMIIFGRVCKP